MEKRTSYGAPHLLQQQVKSQKSKSIYKKLDVSAEAPGRWPTKCI